MEEYTATEWLPANAGLGESPLYRASDDTFFFVDIKHQLCITRLEIVAGREDVLAVQTRLGLALLSLESGALKPLAAIKHRQHGSSDASLDDQTRMNDGAIDARGRWWAGSMALDEESRIGRLWRMDKAVQESTEEASVLELGGLVDTPVPNGPVWSPDDRIMYVNETPASKMFRYDYDAETGKASNKRLFAQLDDGGLPDGMAVDVEGCVWVAVNSKGYVARLSPEGELIAKCNVPGAKMASCPAFGGRDMKTLFITSIAAEGSNGSVYRVEVDAAGITRHQYQA
ncbi:hypothetical protein BD289DRAFT_506312 [Coniella lustricola]|uniref:SMP-30/Gluconolactonase/LRE-like region domain-containing protein n=1 Tax=Coniella lustricola TaxID=2025994 RepID=A0A2T3A718_9PEZI|nr:hypothetical protein BD289DRAFT_506312 [Coniella lustricola]